MKVGGDDKPARELGGGDEPAGEASDRRRRAGVGEVELGGGDKPAREEMEATSRQR